MASPLATNGVLPVLLTVTCSKKGLTVGEGSERVSGRRGVVLMLVHAGDVDLENTRPHGNSKIRPAVIVWTGGVPHQIHRFHDDESPQVLIDHPMKSCLQVVMMDG